MLALAGIGLIVALLFLAPVLALPFPIFLGYNEGWNAYHATSAIAGTGLYPPADALITNNYPPLSFYIVGGLGRLVGDTVIAGRIVALASLLTVGGAIALSVRRLGGTLFAGLLGGLLFLLFIALYGQDYIALDDPQWLGHALMMAGFILFLGTIEGPWRPGRAVAACLLVLAGGLVKHNLVALPLAILVWLLLHDRRQLRLWLIVSALAGGAALGTAVLAHGPVFIADLFGYKRMFLVRQFKLYAMVYAGALLPFLVLVPVLALFTWRRDRGVRVVPIYAAAAALTGLPMLGGAGVWYNVLFDLMIAAFLSAGLLADRILRESVPLHGVRVWFPMTLALLLAAPLLAPIPGHLLDGMHKLRDFSARRREAAEEIAILAAMPGPVACEMPVLCYWAGKPFEIDFFNLGQKIRTGAYDPAPLLDRLDRHYYAAIELWPNDGSERIPEILKDRIALDYQPLHRATNGSVILVPR